MSERNPYEVIGITQTAPLEEIKRQYLLKARVIHPDRFDPVKQAAEWKYANEMLRELNAAWAAINEAHKRGRRADGAEAEPYTKDSRTESQPEPEAEDENSASDSGETQSETEPPPSPGPRKSAQTGRILKWARLPEATRQNILSRMERHANGRTFFFPEIGVSEMILHASIALVTFAILWRATNGARWTDYFWPATLSFAGLWQLLRLGSFVKARLQSEPHDGTLLTSQYLIRFVGGEVWVWHLWDIRGFECKVNLGWFDYATCRVDFGSFSWSFRVWDRDVPVQPADTIKASLNAAQAAARRADNSWFYRNDDFRELKTDGRFPAPSNVSRAWAKQVGIRAALAAVLTVACVSIADRLNDYYDDKIRWDLASSLDKAGGYRRYLEVGGRWTVDARQRLEAVYERAAKSYADTAGKAADPSAASAVREILALARISGANEVAVVFDGRTEMPDNLPELLQRRFGVNHVRPLGRSFAEESMRRRERGILDRIATAFGNAIPADVIQFVADPMYVRAGPRLHVSYTVRPLSTIYFRDKDEQVPEGDRTYFPGIQFDWDMKLESGFSSDQYRFVLRSNPASQIQYRASSGGDDESIYDAMCESAFSAFGTELLRRFGLGVAQPSLPSSK